MKKLVLISLALLTVISLISAGDISNSHKDAEVSSNPIDYREGIIIIPIDRISDDASEQLNANPIDYREDIIIIPIDRISDDASEQLNAEPVDYREGIIVPPIDYLPEDISVRANSTPVNYRDNIIVPPIDYVNEDNSVQMYADPNRRREGIIIPPVHFDPFDHSRNEGAIRIEGINGSANVKMYNLMGNKIIDTQTNGLVDTKGLPSGRYIIIIETDNGTVMGKVTIVK